MKRNNYKIFLKPKSINIVGWRAREFKIDEFNDLLSIYWPRGDGFFDVKVYPVTTLPGSPWLLSPMLESGAAVLVPGQYLDCYKLGLYRGNKALLQAGPVRVYRDASLDKVITMDPKTIDEGLFGIHIHRAGIVSKVVGVSSAGCQVFQAKKDFNEFISLCEKSAQIYGNVFSYTLLDELDGIN